VPEVGLNQSAGGIKLFEYMTHDASTMHPRTFLKEIFRTQPDVAGHCTNIKLTQYESNSFVSRCHLGTEREIPTKFARYYVI